MAAVTIREYFEGVYSRTVRTAIVVVIALAFLVRWRYPRLTRLEALIGLLIAGLILAPVLVLWFRRQFVCPRCGASFQRLRKQQFGRFSSGRWRKFWDLWNACPQCGVRFDDPWP